MIGLTLVEFEIGRKNISQSLFICDRQAKFVERNFIPNRIG